jgi:hypothetical protein
MGMLVAHSLIDGSATLSLDQDTESVGLTAMPGICLERQVKATRAWVGSSHVKQEVSREITVVLKTSNSYLIIDSWQQSLNTRGRVKKSPRSSIFLTLTLTCIVVGAAPDPQRIRRSLRH